MCQNSKFSLPFFVCFLCVCPGPVDDPSQPVWTNWKRGQNAFTPRLPPSYLRPSHHLGMRQNINSAQQKCHKCQTKYKYFLLIKIIEKGRPSSLGRCWSRCCIYNWCFKLVFCTFFNTLDLTPGNPLSFADQLLLPLQELDRRDLFLCKIAAGCMISNLGQRKLFLSGYAGYWKTGP